MPTIYHWTQPLTVSQTRYDELITRGGWFANPTQAPKLDKAGFELGDYRAPGNEYYLWHRGAERVFPENTKEGFRNAIALGAKVIKTDCYDLADGAIGIMHDATVDRTTTSTGTILSYNTATWRNLAVDAGNWFAPAWPNDMRAPLLTEILEEFGHQVTLYLDSKRTQATDAIIATVKRYGLERNVVLCSSDTTLSDAGKARAAGLQYLFYWNNGTTMAVTAAQAKAAGATMLGIGLSYTNAQISDAVAYGAANDMPVHGFTVKRRYERDRFLGLGVKILHCADPFYCQQNVQLRNTDNFASGTPYYGLVPSDAWAPDTLVPYVGTPRRLSFANQNGGTFACLGYLGPLPASYTLTGKVTYDVLTGDNNAWAAIGLATDDRTFNGNAIIEGYNCIMRQSGNFQVYKQIPGAVTDGVTAQGSSSGIAPAGEAGLAVAGTARSFTLQVTPTQIVFTLAGQTVTAVDNTYRPLRYVHVGRASGNTMQASFSEISVA